MTDLINFANKTFDVIRLTGAKKVLNLILAALDRGETIKNYDDVREIIRQYNTTIKNSDFDLDLETKNIFSLGNETEIIIKEKK